MKTKYYPFILALVAAAIKVLLVEIGFALNFVSISYHGLFSRTDLGLELLGALTTLAIAFCFYLAYAYALWLARFDSLFTPLYFVIGLVMATVEIVTFNLPKPKITDLSSAVTIASSDIFIAYLLTYSSAYRQKLGLAGR